MLPVVTRRVYWFPSKRPRVTHDGPRSTNLCGARLFHVYDGDVEKLRFFTCKALSLDCRVGVLKLASMFQTVHRIRSNFPTCQG